jgi:hypothetical protein
VRNFVEAAGNLVGRLPDIVHGREFRDQMARFIPLDVQERTLLKPKYLDGLQSAVARLVKQAGDLAAA